MRTRFVTVAAVTVTLSVLALPSIARPGGIASTWSSAGSPAQAVLQTGAAFLNGKVYMPGGWEAGFTTVYNKMQILTTGSNSWTVDAQAMPGGGVAQASVCASGSKIYVVDGISQGGALLSSLLIYDPSKPQGSRWSTGPAPSTTHDGALFSRDGGCAWIGGKLYLFGGQAESANGTITGISDFTWVFNPGTGKWADTGFTMPAKKWLFGYTSDGTNAYIAGGEDANDNYLRSTARFKPATGWSKLPTLPKPKGGGTGYEWPGMGILGTGLALFGGGTTLGYQGRTLVCANPCTSTSTWTNANKNLQTPRAEMAYASGGSTPTLYAIDGQGVGGVLSTAEKTT